MRTSEFEIVRADLKNATHARAFLNLTRTYAEDPMGGGKDLSDDVKANLVRVLRKRSGVYILLAFVEDHAAGLLTSMEGFSTFFCKPVLNIHDAIVKTEYRRRGIFRHLFIEVEKIALERDCCRLTLEVLEGNSVAQSAYSNFGFKSYELDPKMGKALFLEKKLSKLLS